MPNQGRTPARPNPRVRPSRLNATALTTVLMMSPPMSIILSISLGLLSVPALVAHSLGGVIGLLVVLVKPLQARGDGGTSLYGLRRH